MRLAPEGLRSLARAIFRAAGSDEAEAAIVADDLVEANLQGHDSHGVVLLPIYVRRQIAGELRVNQHARFVRDDAPFAVVDGNLGFGQVIAREAMDWAIATARSGGIAVTALRNTHHIGRVGAYGEQVCAAGLVSLHFVNVISGQPVVASFGGRGGRFGTNPICIAVPGGPGQAPVILDFATSAIAAGKVRVALNAGRQVPAGALIDAEGQPTTEPGDFFNAPRGALLPFGGHKGSGLALMCEILGGALTGAGTNQPATPKDGPTTNGMLSFVIDPARLCSTEAFQAELEAIIAHTRDSAPAVPGEAVLVAGEPERRRRRDRLAGGIPLDDRSWEEIREAARSVAIPAGMVEAAILAGDGEAA
ncbi:malate/lactate/ureidoglycolate dehydrogenase [Muricoccus radiodurans]|uniref:malate/lactate/ureidoglycolate dehydrogenase n=1 Tax=Muricoccus radiodurans TaxID=2231721 RepID=UPI003CE96421